MHAPWFQNYPITISQHSTLAVYSLDVPFTVETNNRPAIIERQWFAHNKLLGLNLNWSLAKTWHNKPFHRSRRSPGFWIRSSLVAAR
jgi:hypothetical protein